MLPGAALPTARASVRPPPMNQGARVGLVLCHSPHGAPLLDSVRQGKGPPPASWGDHTRAVLGFYWNAKCGHTCAASRLPHVRTSQDGRLVFGPIYWFRRRTGARPLLWLGESLTTIIVGIKGQVGTPAAQKE